MKELRLAHELALPIDAVTDTIAIVAKRRVGKSYCARRFAEQIYRADQQVVIVDPKGDHWGIRFGSDGRSPGLPIVILGGEHADVPLEPQSGELVAKLVVEDRVSALIDLSAFRKHQVATFMTDFLETLYRLKAREMYRTPVMLVIDEADAIAPQRPQKGEERMLGAAEDIVRRGGQRGIGCTLVTQRTAVLNKNVLTQAQILIALRTLAPNDLAAMRAWIEVHGTEEQERTLMESLPSLPVGDAWFWSPGWPTEEGIFQRVHILPIETFDSGATPKAGERRFEPRNMADIDLPRLRDQMSATLERARENDPKELRREVESLRAQLNEQAPRVDEDDVRQRIESQIKKQIEERFGVLISNLELHLAATREVLDDILRVTADRGNSDGDGKTDFESYVERFDVAPEREAAAHAPMRTAARERSREPVTTATREGVRLTGGERKILTALAQYPSGRSKSQVAILTEYSQSGGCFNNYLSALRSKGFIDGYGEHLQITKAGVDALGWFEPLPRGRALAEHWFAKLGRAEKTILEKLLAVHPKKLTKERVAALAGYEPSGGGFNNALSRLRTLELITRGAEMKASDVFFEERGAR